MIQLKFLFENATKYKWTYLNITLNSNTVTHCIQQSLLGQRKNVYLRLVDQIVNDSQIVNTRRYNVVQWEKWQSLFDAVTLLEQYRFTVNYSIIDC